MSPDSFTDDGTHFSDHLKLLQFSNEIKTEERDGKSACGSQNINTLAEQDSPNCGLMISEKAGTNFENHAEISGAIHLRNKHENVAKRESRLNRH